MELVGTRSRHRAAGTQSRTFCFVDLFAGIGGFRIGLEAVGGRCVHTVEIDRFARRTYESWFEAAPDGADIHDVRTLPAHHVMAAGFPCQPFSIAGVSKKLSLGRQHGFLDKTQGTLFFELRRLIATSRPPVILLENVRNLRSHDAGRTFDVIMETLDEELDYEMAWRIVDARAWVPQHRERIFFVGFDRRVYNGRQFLFPDPPNDRPVLASILEPDMDVDERYVLSDHLWQYLQEYAAKHKAAGNGFGYGLVGPDDVARTLSARYHKDGSEILVRTGRGSPRRLTPRECARLMGFPDDRGIVVSDTQAYRQFGNAVVVPVVEHLARAIVDQAGFSTMLDRPEELMLPLPAVVGA